MTGEKMIVSIRAFEARNLPQADTFSESDPYVKLVWGDQSVSSHVTQDDPNPRWDALSLGLEGNIDREAPSGEIRVEIWDEDKLTPDDLMASLTIPLARLLKEGRIEDTFELELAAGMVARSKSEPAVLRATIAVLPSFAAVRKYLVEQGVPMEELPQRELLHLDLPEAVGPYGLEMGYSLSNYRLSLVRYEFDDSDHPIFVEPNEGYPLEQRIHAGISSTTGNPHELRSLVSPLVDGDFNRIVLRRFESEIADRSSVLETIEALRGQAPRQFDFKSVAAELAKVKDVIIEPAARRILVPYAPANDGAMSMLSMSFIQVGKLRRMARTLLQLEIYEPRRRKYFTQLTDDNGMKLPQEIRLGLCESHGYTFGQRITLREVDISQLPLSRIIIERRVLRNPIDFPLGSMWTKT